MVAIDALWDARAKWRDIGRRIGVDEGTLDTIRAKDDGENLSDVLRHWLRGVYNPKEKNSKPRAWHTLIEALRNRVVNEEAMANKLEKEKYPDTNPGIIIMYMIILCDRRGLFHIRCDSFLHFSYTLKA